MTGPRTGLIRELLVSLVIGGALGVGGYWLFSGLQLTTTEARWVAVLLAVTTPFWIMVIGPITLGDWHGALRTVTILLAVPIAFIVSWLLLIGIGWVLIDIACSLFCD